MTEYECSKPYRKQDIPKAICNTVGQHLCKVFEHKCYVDWCELINPLIITGYDQLESKEGTLDINNIKPCARRNLSIDNYTIQDGFNYLVNHKSKRKNIVFNIILQNLKFDFNLRIQVNKNNKRFKLIPNK